MERIVNRLKELNKSVSVMESCTGGSVTNEITNISGSSEVLKFSAVTYSTEFKVKMGVMSSIINGYGVYSIETAKSMAKSISEFTSSNYGIGITGRIKTESDKDNEIYVSIYDADNDRYYVDMFKSINGTRSENKKNIVSRIIKLFEGILNI